MHKTKSYKFGETALHYGAGDIDVVGVLLQAGADIHAKNNVSICITCIYKQIII